MSQRIRQLEDALRISHALSSQDTHPLLLEPLLRIKELDQSLDTDTDVSTQPATAFPGDGSGGSTSSLTDRSSESDLDSLLPALGTLSISCGGRSQYSGPSALRHVRFLALSAMASNSRLILGSIPGQA
jgi:hypothetical protein